MSPIRFGRSREFAAGIEAARALAGPPEAQIPAADRDALAKALAEYIAVQTYNADRPEGRMNLANLYAAPGLSISACWSPDSKKIAFISHHLLP